jgi:probable rRNA maturation factor
MLRSLNLSNRALSVVFVGAREMRGLNRRYLQRDYATDVLSFAYGDMIMEHMPFLGEVVIAPQIAADHAARYRIRPERELRKLLVHGVLHLLGYDHETDTGQMNRFQTRLLRRKFFKTAPSLANFKVKR